jgi:hypothetical protein
MVAYAKKCEMTASSACDLGYRYTAENASKMFLNRFTRHDGAVTTDELFGAAESPAPGEGP